jgi:hypothetical protein
MGCLSGQSPRPRSVGRLRREAREGALKHASQGGRLFLSERQGDLITLGRDQQSEERRDARATGPGPLRLPARTRPSR